MFNKKILINLNCLRVVEIQNIYIYICDNRDYQLRSGILIISAIYVTNHNNNYHIFYIDRVIIYNYLIRFGIRCTRI